MKSIPTTSPHVAVLLAALFISTLPLALNSGGITKSQAHGTQGSIRDGVSAGGHLAVGGNHGGVMDELSSSKDEVPNYARKQTLSEQYKKLPLTFETNHGQTDSQVRFLSRGDGYSLFLTQTEAVLSLRNSSVANKEKPDIAGPNERPTLTEKSNADVVRMRLLDANPSPTMEGVDVLPGKSNYLTGNDLNKWRTDVSHHAKVQYKDVYPGIDLIYYGNQRQLEYDFVVYPGSNPDKISISFSGVASLSLSETGDLVLTTPHGELRQPRPVTYQVIDGIRQAIACNYVVNGKQELGFEIAAYDPGLPLVIDPILTYSTFLGGGGYDDARDVVVDAAGAIFIAGYSTSIDFPTANAVQPAFGGAVLGGGDAFVTKISPDGSSIVYSTYLGGSFDEYAEGIAVDAAGNAYITGATHSPDFPTVNPIQAQHANLTVGIDVFVAKLNSSGSGLIFSTFLGGSGLEVGRAIALDAAENIYVTGQSSSFDFPRVNAHQFAYGGDLDGFLVKVNSAGTTLGYSTFMGGDSSDLGMSLRVDSSGNTYIAGATSSTNFPTLNPIQASRAGHRDAFVRKYDPSGNLAYSTYFGGDGGDMAHDIALDGANNIYVAGDTNSGNFPTFNAWQPFYASPDAGHDCFIAKLNATDGSVLYSTYLGGSSDDSCRGISVDENGNAFLTGVTRSVNFPTLNGFQLSFGGGFADAFVTKLNAGGGLDHSSYLGGGNYEEGADISVDTQGNLYVVGHTVSSDFPRLTPLPYEWANYQAFVSKISDASSTGTLQMAQTSYRVSEGAGSVTLSVTRAGGDSGAVSVQYATTDGAATSGVGEDYGTPSPTTLYWGAGDSSPKEITIPLNDDSVFEGEEQFSVSLSNPAGGATLAGPSSAEVTIVENDAAPVFGFQSLGQGEGNATSSNFGIFITKTGNTALNATLDYQTIPGTATAGSSCDEPGVDYVTTSGTLTFLPHETSKLLRVVVCGGTEPEPDETFTIPFVNPGNGIILPGTGISTFWIANDDKFAPTVIASIESYTYDGTGHAAEGSAAGTDGATLSPAVTLTYSGTGATNYPASATPPSAAGTYQAVANYTGNGSYRSGASAPVPYTIFKAMPVVSWDDPADIVYGRPLGSSQLNATASAPGSFTYTPGAGTLLAAGVHTVQVNFTPEDAANYEAASKDVTLNVGRAPLTVTADDQSRRYGEPNLALDGSITGIQNADDISALYSTTATEASDAGSYPITIRLSDPSSRLGNYDVTLNHGTLAVGKADQLISWSDPAPIVYGTALTAAQLNATVAVVGPSPPGAVSYSPSFGTLLHAAGGQILTVEVAGTNNYNPASKTVHIDVQKATVVVNWANPAAISYGVALSGAQLNASAAHPADGGPLDSVSLAGTFIYAPPPGTVLPVGGNILSVTFTPANAGDYNPATGVVVQRVNYAICALYDQTKAVRSGGTVSIRLALCDASGANLSSPGVVLTAVGTRLVSPDPWGDVEDTSNPDPDMNFRFTNFDPVTPGYVYNLRTKGVATGVYQLGFYVGNDPTVYTVQFQIR